MMNNDSDTCPPVDPLAVIKEQLVQQIEKVVPYDLSKPLINQYDNAVVTPQNNILDEFTKMIAISRP